MHEWRRSPPNDRTVLLYERARLYAVHVNEPVDLSELLAEIDRILARQSHPSTLARMIERGLQSARERLWLNAMLDRSIVERARDYAIKYHSAKIAQHGSMMRLFRIGA